MSKKIYNKPFKSFDDQIKLLQSRNLDIQDISRAKMYLQQINYYRLSAYFLPFQSSTDKFDTGTTFEHIIKTYTFDRELRLLVFDAIERIEIAIRTQFVYQLAQKYSDSHWQDNSSIFIKPIVDRHGNIIDPYNEFQDIIRKAIKSKKPEVFIKHYIDEYHRPSNPPSWMCFELLTIGELSRLYKGLRNKDDKKLIANYFKLHPTVFQSWLHALAYVRNICAHHSRLWNRDLAVEPILLNRTSEAWVSNKYNNNKRVFYFYCTLRYMLNQANKNNDFNLKLDQLLKKYPLVPIKYIGIPSDGTGILLDWTKEPLFK
jgi:abortive infection bacteriophage resistance protein